MGWWGWVFLLSRPTLSYQFCAKEQDPKKLITWQNNKNYKKVVSLGGVSPLFATLLISHMVEYDEIAYSMNIVSLFLVTYEASCGGFLCFLCNKMYSNGQHIHVGLVWNQFCFLEVSWKLVKLKCNMTSIIR